MDLSQIKKKASYHNVSGSEVILFSGDSNLRLNQKEVFNSKLDFLLFVINSINWKKFNFNGNVLSETCPYVIKGGFAFQLLSNNMISTTDIDIDVIYKNTPQYTEKINPLNTALGYYLYKNIVSILQHLSPSFSHEIPNIILTPNMHPEAKYQTVGIQIGCYYVSLVLNSKYFPKVMVLTSCNDMMMTLIEISLSNPYQHNIQHSCVYINMMPIIDPKKMIENNLEVMQYRMNILEEHMNQFDLSLKYSLDKDINIIKATNDILYYKSRIEDHMERLQYLLTNITFDMSLLEQMIMILTDSMKSKVSDSKGKSLHYLFLNYHLEKILKNMSNDIYDMYFEKPDEITQIIQKCKQKLNYFF